MNVGERVRVRESTPSFLAGQVATVLAIHPKLSLYHLRFEDGYETWFERKEIRKP